MSLIRMFALPALGLALALVPASASAQSHVVLQPGQVQWGPAPPVFPAGAEIAVLEGDPGSAATTTLRLRFPANYAIAPHWHSMAERVTVMSGALNVGMGDRLDRSASQKVDAGGYVSLPSKMHHFAWTAVPTVVQITLDGPFDMVYINPADNPQRSQSRQQ